MGKGYLRSHSSDYEGKRSELRVLVSVPLFSMLSLFVYPEAIESGFLQIVGNVLPGCTVPQPRKQQFLDVSSVRILFIKKER
jgi:hypothetical protein